SYLHMVIYYVKRKIAATYTKLKAKLPV
ncbi:hypothetical protein ATL10_10973, partial [Bacillus sp. 196mf]